MIKSLFARKKACSTFLGLSICLAIYFSCITWYFLAFPSLSLAKAAGGTVYYVSKNGNNNGGTSWANAWSELNRISWSVIRPGDTVLIDGGTNGMTYTTTLSIQKSGTAGAPITIERATTPGHNGVVKFFGGNTEPLPYCGQTQWATPTGTVGDAIDMNGNSYITIDGASWNGIQITGYTYIAVYFSGGESNDLVRHLEIYDNGNAAFAQGSWSSEFPAVELHGVNNNITFQYMNTFDNGEDNFQSGGGNNNFTIENSWMHYTRTVPGVPSESYNLCSHNDGFQIFGSTPSNGITFRHDIFGPGLTNGFIFQPTVTNVLLSDSLVLDPGSNVTIGNSGGDSNWNVDHVTSIAQDDNLTFEGSGNSITNSILYGGNLLLNNSIAHSANNCEWNTTDTQSISVLRADPRFATSLAAYTPHTNNIRQYPPLSLLQNGSFSLLAGSPCAGRGSSIPSVSSFLQAAGGSLPSSASTPTPTATPFPTQNPVVIPAGPAVNGQTPSRSAGPARANGANPWIILLIVLLCLLAFGAGVFFLLRYRYRQARR